MGAGRGQSRRARGLLRRKRTVVESLFAANDFVVYKKSGGVYRVEEITPMHVHMLAPYKDGQKSCYVLLGPDHSLRTAHQSSLKKIEDDSPKAKQWQQEQQQHLDMVAQRLEDTLRREAHKQQESEQGELLGKRRKKIRLDPDDMKQVEF